MIEVNRPEPMSKKEFIEEVLANTLRCAGMDIKMLELSSDEKSVLILFDTGYGRRVDVEGDSFGAIIMDVTRKALY